MSKKRKFLSGKEKVSIIRSHLVDKVKISDLCEKHGIQPTVFYRWQKEFFENGEMAFSGNRKKAELKAERKVKQLEDKLTQKNEVISELMEEHLLLKKNLGEI